VVTPDDDAALEALIEYVRDQRYFDFTGYKRASLARRVRKRVEALPVDGLGGYLAWLHEHPEEFEELFNTILINVTSFFRDQVSWDAIRERVLPALLAERHPEDPVRVWCAGCATGQEAYTIAMLLCDAMGEEAFRVRAKIYGTDVDSEALGVARHARYPLAQLEQQIPEGMVDRFFDREGTHGVFRKDLRRTLIFGRHDLVQDPPISRVDLLSCRNTFMYFTAAAQTQILQKFHFALKPSGYLLLGRSEALVSRTDAFTAFDLPRRVFTKARRPGERARPELPRESTRNEETAMDPSTTDVRGAGFDLSPVAQVLVDLSNVVQAINHQARVLFGLSSRDVGRPLADLELSYRPLELRSRLETVLAERHAVAVRGVQWTVGADTRWFDVLVSPLTAPTGALEGASFSFVDVTVVRRVQEELDRSRGELETAYEELQSTNEELEAINDELRQRTDQLHEVNVFLESILTSLHCAVVVVDRDMRVKVWNRHATELWGLRSDEVEGVHLMNLDIGLPMEQILQAVRSSLGVEPTEAEVVVHAVNRRGRAVSCRVRATPLFDGEDTPTGAILLMDATEATPA
jgi:two-component system CheB/CheR fusion protein